MTSSSLYTDTASESLPDEERGKGSGSRTTPDHTPVLLAEVIAGLAVRANGIYLDGTVGMGGHAEAILCESAPNGRLLGIDADPSAVELARARLQRFGSRAVVVQGNFRDLRRLAAEQGFSWVDGIVLDLGVSSLQLSRQGRGFSFLYEAPLDMRMDPSRQRTAAQVVNESEETELAEILRRYGEEPQARRLARALVRRRPIGTTIELAQTVEATLGRHPARIHPATRTFQALRIAVNEELQSLTEGLAAAADLLRPGARLATISFHSLEDRIVKDYIRRESRDCICPHALPVCICTHRSRLRPVGSKVVVPTAAEIALNPRSRSAKLRLAERLD
ncbi:MAG: 16S rRNA (cytosine(1402)-N(4))-methyltransferase RsmH [Dehalococcoidia bacterium]